MATYDENTKQSALALLHAGKEPNLVASHTKVPLATVYRWSKELSEAKLNGEVDKLLDLDRALLAGVIDKTKNELPELAEAAGKLTNNISYADRLSSELQKTAMHLTQQARNFAMSADSASDLLIVTEVICDLQNAFFNSNSTQVNIQNNVGTPYAGFLSDKPEGVTVNG